MRFPIDRFLDLKLLMKAVISALSPIVARWLHGRLTVTLQGIYSA